MEAKEQFSLSQISLRPFKTSDIDDFMVWATDERVTKFMTWEPYTSKETALNYITTTAIPHPWYRAICLNNRPIGSISVAPNPGVRGELGYVLAYEYWGRGIATKAVNLMKKTVFQDLGELERVEALVDVENGGSQRVLEKAGFKRGGVLRECVVVKGKCRDMVVFSLSCSDCAE